MQPALGVTYTVIDDEIGGTAGSKWWVELDNELMLIVCERDGLGRPLGRGKFHLFHFKTFGIECESVEFAEGCKR